MRPLPERDRWVLRQLADDDQHFDHLAFLGGGELQVDEAIDALLSLLAAGHVEVRECYAGDSWSRELPPEEATAVTVDRANWPGSARRGAAWYEASATESGLVALWGPRDRPYRDRYLP